MDNTFSTEEKDMKCSIQGCPGEYEKKLVFHTLIYGNEVFVFEHVPAEVCSVCGDTLLKPDTVRRLESFLQKTSQPKRLVPLYEYA